MKSNRLNLQNYYGESVVVKGTIAKISTKRGEQFNYQTVLIRKVSIITENDEIKLDHMWFPINGKYYIGDYFERSGTVSCYQRRNGAYEYSVNLK